MPVRMVVVAVGALFVVATGCTNPWAGPDAADLAKSSTTDVLVPDDPRFADSFEFTLEESPDNYTVRSNWDPEFNPDIDPSSAVTGFQIGDPTTWTGEVDAENDAQRAAFVAVLDDARTPGPGTPCDVAVVEPRVIACSYDVGQVDPLPLLVRFFADDTRELTVVIVGSSGPSLDYLSGDFTAHPIDVAVDRWLHD